MIAVATTPAARKAVWSRCAARWAASLPHMSTVDFTHEAQRIAAEPASAGARFMRDAVEAERHRRHSADIRRRLRAARTGDQVRPEPVHLHLRVRAVAS